MKTPRLEDFDQTPKRPVKELFSPIDDMPRIEKPTRESPAPQRHGASVAASPGDEVAASPPRRTTSKRLLVRRGFDYYDDQLAKLKKLSLREQMAGRDGSMSRMLREALDHYLAEATRTRRYHVTPPHSPGGDIVASPGDGRADRPGLYNPLFPFAYIYLRRQGSRRLPLRGVCD